jgi:hypothetical protein
MKWDFSWTNMALAEYNTLEQNSMSFDLELESSIETDIVTGGTLYSCKERISLLSFQRPQWNHRKEINNMLKYS